MKKLILLTLTAALSAFAQNPRANRSMLAQSLNATVAASSTSYIAFGNPAFNAAEASRQTPVPFTCQAGQLYAITAGTQSATGSLVITVRKNAAATPVVITVPAGGVAGVYSDPTDRASFSPGDLLSIQFVNNATAISAAIVGISLGCN